jgi:hypothetical protein
MKIKLLFKGEIKNLGKIKGVTKKEATTEVEFIDPNGDDGVIYIVRENDEEKAIHI